MNNAIEIKNLSKKYKGFSLDNVSFNLPKGTIMGLIGENGAGKTTIIKTILDISFKDKGDIKIFGKDMNKNLREDIGVVLDDGFFSDFLKANSLPNIMKNIYKNWDNEKYFYYLKRLSIPEDKIIKQLSRGNKMKLGIALALSHNPKLLILDEPTSGLDPIVREEILDIFQEFIQDEENSVLVSSHITSDLEKIADYITFIHSGRLVFSKEKDELLYDYGIYKTSLEDLDLIDKKFIESYRKHNYGVDILIKNIDEFKVKYKNSIVEKPSIENIMLFFVKGEK
ncbi:MAG: ABC transporter ATP-binding protein [Tissierellia bacterium]|nr:ABC transporter ATP-binding protein [Tissierellia bacterium]